MIVGLQRYILGRAEWRRLSKAEYIIVAFGKSGRTWLRFMLSRFYQLRFNLPPDVFLIDDNLHRLNPAIPVFHFTHDDHLADYTGNGDKSDYYDRKVILLVRDPRDTAVSQYFQWKYRMKALRKWINRYPTFSTNLSLFDFVMREKSGLPKIVSFMNSWARNLEKVRLHHLVRYEDLHANPIHTLSELLHFLGEEPTLSELTGCVEFSSVENMRQLEASGAAKVLGRRLQPGNPQNPDSFKVRRAKVGGYRDYFDSAEILILDSFVTRELSPFFKYSTKVNQ